MRFGNRTTASYALVTALFATGCSNAPQSECTECAVVQSALTNNQVLGFEDVSGWSTSNGTLASSTIRSQGNKSLAISGIGYAEITSAALSSLGQVNATISYDLRIPSPQPNPDWWGQTQLFIDLPSKGIYNAFIGARELIGSPVDQFRTVFYSLSPDMVTKLSGTYSDLRIKIVVNAPTGSGTYRLDNLKVAGSTAPTEWPNDLSKTNSDPWLISNHNNVTKLKPQVLVLNFDNNRGPAAATAQVNAITAAFREGSRYRGYLNSSATSLLEPQTNIVDLRDGVNGRPPAPPSWSLPNSTLMPRRSEPCGPGTSNNYCFDFKQLFNETFAQRYGYPDPANPGQFLNLCELAEQGKVHEVWMYFDPDDPANVDETSEWAPQYNMQRQRLSGDGNRCAGHGCFDADVPHCNVSLRIGYINSDIGPGFFIHSWSHSMEDKLGGSGNSVPFITPYFNEFADFDLSTRYGMPFDRWYALGYKNPDPPEATYPCDAIKWTSSTSIAWHINYPDWTTCTDPPRTTVSPYIPRCGSVHFPPNARRHYDEFNTFQVMSTCQGWRRKENGGQDLARAFSKAAFEGYNQIAPGGASGWLVWWMQNMPGHNSGISDNNNQPMLSFLPIMYY